MYQVPIMSVSEAVKALFEEVLDERTRGSILWSMFHAKALQKMGYPGIAPSFGTAVTLELNKQAGENERFLKFLRALEKL